MNAKLPVKKIFIDIFIRVGLTFLILFSALIAFVFMRAYAESEQVEVTMITGLLICYLGLNFFGISLYFFAILYFHYEIRNKIIKLGFTILRIDNRKFKFERDEAKYTLELIGYKHIFLRLTFEDGRTTIIVYSMNNLEELLSQMNE